MHEYVACLSECRAVCSIMLGTMKCMAVFCMDMLALRGIGDCVVLFLSPYIVECREWVCWRTCHRFASLSPSLLVGKPSAR